MFHVGVCCAIVSAHCSFVVIVPDGKELAFWLSCLLWFLVFCHFPKCVLVHIRIMGEVGSVKLV